MKHSRVKTSFQAPGMGKVQDRLAVLHMTSEEREAYYRYLKEVTAQEDRLQSAENQGLAKGYEKGKVEGKAEGSLESKVTIAKKLFELDFSLEEVSRITSLSLEELQQLGFLHQKESRGVSAGLEC